MKISVLTHVIPLSEAFGLLLYLLCDDRIAHLPKILNKLMKALDVGFPVDFM